MSNLAKDVLDVVGKNPGCTSTLVVERFPNLMPIKIQEIMSRMYKQKKLDCLRLNGHFLYSLPKTSMEPKTHMESVKTDFSEYLVIVHRNNKEFRKGLDNNVDLNGYLSTLESDDQVAVYRRMECQKKTIWQI